MVYKLGNDTGLAVSATIIKRVLNNPVPWDCSKK